MRLNDIRRIALNPRTLLAFLHDVCAIGLAWILAYLLRFNFHIPQGFLAGLWQLLLWAMPFQAFLFIGFGLYRGVWRFASLPDLKRILLSVTVSAIAIAALLFMFQPTVVVPRSVLILEPILLVVIMGGSRFAYRAWKEHKLYGFAQMDGTPVLVLGSGDAALALLKDLARSEKWRVVGMLDDDEGIHGRELFGVKILGNFADLPRIVNAFNVRHAIVAMPSAAHESRRKAVGIANQAGLIVLTVPSFEDLMSGKVSISQIRPVEVEDLLGREPVKLDDQGLHALLEDQVVMVSGAGGSIGSELCRQIARYEPRLLVCLDLSEYALYRIEQEFAAAFPTLRAVYAVGDIRNGARLQHILTSYRPTVVFHAAAYKHVPLMENINVNEALSNNVTGTYTLAKACKDVGIERFVLISTDKAVNPANVMGASKRLAEMVCQGLQEESGTRFVIVRFGNVLGSSGSVIPKFREQIAKGGPVTVTHPEITRYFMSIPEAAQLVMQAGLMGEGGEIFVLDMGKPVRIVDLARDMIQLSGLQPEDVEIIFTGLRPGEKLYEELLSDDERTLPTPHAKLRIAVARTADKAWVKALLEWIDSTSTYDESRIKRELKMWVEEYTGGDAIASPENQPLVPKSSTIH
jgi:FlaA1/EpsC-like NDP-sugar epimerase